MGADMTSLVRIMEETEGRTRDLFTRDFLGSATTTTTTAQSDIHVPSTWERHLDLMSGRTYLNKIESDQSNHGMHDLNLPPPSSSGFQLPDESTLLDLKLSRHNGDVNTGYCRSFQSVCTLEKVKSALERAGRAGRARVCEMQVRQSEFVSSTSASPSSSTTSSSMKRRLVGEEDDGGSAPAGGMMVAACPSCLLYVLIAKANPRCPRCESHVPMAFIPKKMKLDLNST